MLQVKHATEFQFFLSATLSINLQQSFDHSENSAWSQEYNWKDPCGGTLL